MTPLLGPKILTTPAIRQYFSCHVHLSMTYFCFYFPASSKWIIINSICFIEKMSNKCMKINLKALLWPWLHIKTCNLDEVRKKFKHRSLCGEPMGIPPGACMIQRHFFYLIGLYRDVDKVEIWNENVLQTLKYLKATVSTNLSTYLSVKVVFEVNGANLHG